MWMRLFLALLALPIIGVLWLAAMLIPAHWQIRQVQSPLPAVEDIAAALQVTAGPSAISYINTATQSGPLGTIGHPGIVIEWPNGRGFLIDTGMPPEQAIAFGRPMETLMDAKPSQTFGAIHTQMGAAINSIAGIAFSHLHSDHTEGLVPLCAAQARPATVFQSTTQRNEINYTTQPGEDALSEARCPRQSLSAGTIKRVPGFPGLVAITAGGHTPGSTVYAVKVGRVNWVFAGDITNDMHSLHNDLDKPWVYRTLIIPEDTARLQQLRQWLQAMDQTPDFEVLVAHDIGAFEASAIPHWQ